MKILSLLMEIDENERLIKENNKILKNRSYICVLKKIKEEFEVEKATYKEKEEELNNIREEYKKVTLKINNLKKELDELEFKLYNEAGSNLKLIEGLQKNIEDNKNTAMVLEDKALDMLQNEEKYSKEKEILRIKLVELRNNFYTHKDVLNKKINKAKEDIEKSKKYIANVEKLIPQNILKEFKSIRERKGSGAGKIENGVCTGCKIKVSSMTRDKIAKEDQIVYCDNCGRIVYYNDSKGSKNAK